jgi:hypothetical protein
LPLLAIFFLENHFKKVEENLCLLEVNKCIGFLPAIMMLIHGLRRKYVTISTTKYKDKNAGILLEDNIDK